MASQDTPGITTKNARGREKKYEQFTLPIKYPSKKLANPHLHGHTA